MFNIQVGRDDLFDAIYSVSSTVGNNSQNLGDDCISITDMGNFIAEIYTTNSIEFSRVSISITSGTATTKPERMPFVSFKRFKAMIESIPSGEYITIKSNVNDIEITYGTRKKPLKLTGSSNGMIPLPVITSPNANEITIEKDIVDKAVKDATTIINDDVTNALASCIRISCNNYNVEITAIDTKNNRMYLHKGTSTESNMGEVLVEGNKFKKALKLFNSFRDLNFESDGNITRIYGSDIGYTNTSLLSAEYYSRVLTGKYPTNISSMFDNVNEYAKINKDELKNSLVRINAIEDSTIGSGTMDLTIDNNFINIVKKSQYGTVEDSFSIENNITNPIKDTFKAKALAEILKNISDNASYNTPNTFEIGKKTAQSNNGSYYVLRETGNGDTMYLITGYSNTSTNP